MKRRGVRGEGLEPGREGETEKEKEKERKAWATETKIYF